jgi:hypothetical protein
MYRCDQCGENHDGKQNKRVSEVRNVNYSIYVMKGTRGGKEQKPTFYCESQGQEIVSEQLLCTVCAKQLEATPARVSNDIKTLECKGTKPKERVEDTKPVYNDYEREKYEEVETNK